MTNPVEFTSRTISLSRQDLRDYAEASGDHNPIHLDDTAAQALGLPGVIAHGMLTWARVLSEVAAWAGGMDRLHDSAVRFANPVVVPADAPATLEISARLKDSDPQTGLQTLILTVMCDGVKVFGKARVDVQAPEMPEGDVIKK